METTKTNREEAARRSRQETPKKPRNPASQEAARKPQSRPQEGAAPKRPQTSRTAQPKGAAKKQAPKQQGKTAVKERKTSLLKRPRSRQEADDLSSTKPRAYGNSKEKKKSAIAAMGDAVSGAAKKGADRHHARQKAQGKRYKRSTPQEPVPVVIYTQPQAFNRDRLLIQLITVTAIVVAFVVGISVFFKVENISVKGASVYSEDMVSKASGIEKGDILLTFNRARAGASIKANLPYVKTVSFGIKLPDTVNIIIEEENVVYAIQDTSEGWWLINSDGHIVDQSNAGQAANYTQILGVKLDRPLRGQTAVAAEQAPVAPTVDPTGETAENTEPTVALSATVTGAQRLSIAFKILAALEANDIVGEAASVNVSQTQSITLWYGTRYQVNLGTDANLEEKIATMNDVILQMSEYQSGILDISYTIFPDKVVYTPFS